jgi:transposase
MWGFFYAASAAALRSRSLRKRIRSAHRYNDFGIEDLKSFTRPGREPFLTDEQQAVLKALAIAGPNSRHNKVVRWHCVDLREKIARRFSVEVHESTVGKWLRQLGLTRLQPRPFHPKKNALFEM